MASKTDDGAHLNINDHIQQVQNLANADAAGDVAAHGKLMEAIHKLQLAAETPFDTTLRQRFQVCGKGCSIGRALTGSYHSHSRILWCSSCWRMAYYRL
jgi:hypothetical protein